MKKGTGVFFALLLGVALCGGSCVPAEKPAVQPGPNTLFVATDGNDGWSGRFPMPNRARTDGPFATLARARDEIRKRKAAGGLAGGATVYLRGGTYFLAEPFVLGPEDSGKEAPLIYAAYPGEKPILSGGRPIRGWQKPTAGSIWTADIPEVKAGQWYFQQLFVNGERRPRARIPKSGYLLNEGPIEPLTDRDKAMKDPNAKNGFRFKPGDIRRWSNLDDAVVYQFHSWTASLHWIQSLDEKNGIVRFTAPADWPTGYWTEHERYYIENVPEALDSPGEWYLDRKTGVLSYWPLPGEDMAKAQVIAPKLRYLLRLDGDPEKGQFVRGIVFMGLSFQHADWLIQDKGPADGQAAHFLDAAIMARGARQCAFHQCEIAHIGEYALWLRAGCQENAVHHCELRDLGGGGVRIGETASPKSDAMAAEHNGVVNCFIHDVGNVFPSGIGVWIGRSSYNTVSHNEICDLNYTGVSVGWSWGYDPSSAHHNLIEYNHIHHVGRGVLGDMGGIYTLGVSPGTVLRGNVVHDVYSPGVGGGTGIYPDEGSTGLLIENNLAYNTEQGCFSQHYGKENVVRNNIWAFSLHGEVARYRQEDHLSFTFERNIVYGTTGEFFIGGWSNGKYQIDRNVYWDASTPDPEFNGMDFADWQALGRDKDSLLADPLFVDPEHRDFRLKADSPALKLGFQPFDPAKAGLYGESEWVALPKSIVRTPMPLPRVDPAFPETLDDGFEDTPVGERAKWAVTSGEEKGASIRVTDEAATGGKHSLKFTDAPGLDHAWQPHLFYTPRYNRGIAHLSFDVRIEPGAIFVHEWRDASQPYLVGPSITIDKTGQLAANGRPMMEVPIGYWIHFDIVAALGKQATGSYDLAVTFEGQPPGKFMKVPTGNPAWKSLRWLGFISLATEKTVFYLDNVKLHR